MTTVERTKRWNDNFYKWNNFNDDGNTWVAVGNTYAIKEDLKKAKAKFSQELGWHFDFEPIGFKTVKINVDSVAYKSDTGKYHFNENVIEMMTDLQSKFIEPTNSEWIGEIGNRLTSHAYLRNTHQFQGTFGLTSVFTFEDEFENSIVWITSKYVNVNVGDFCEISGIIKAHNIFRGDKQTVLTRCRCNVIKKGDEE